MRIIRTLFSFFSIIFISIPAHADSHNGAFFLQACSGIVKQLDEGVVSPKESELSLYCLGYVEGFIDANTLDVDINGARKIICQPVNSISNEQTIHIFIKYLRENPLMLHKSGRSLLLLALANEFPCSK